MIYATLTGKSAQIRYNILRQTNNAVYFDLLTDAPRTTYVYTWNLRGNKRVKGVF